MFKLSTIKRFALAGFLAIATWSCSSDDDGKDPAPVVDNDETAPSVSLQATSSNIMEGEVVLVLKDGEVTLAISGEDEENGSGLARIELYEGEEKIKEFTEEDNEFNYKVTGEGLEHITLTAVAYDKEENKSEEVSLIISVGMRLEAESGAIVEGKRGKTEEREQASGGWIVREIDEAGSGVDLNFTAPSAGVYKMIVAGSTGFDGNNGYQVYVDGNAENAQYAFFDNLGWYVFAPSPDNVTFDLSAGDHTLNLRKESDETTGWAELDYIDVFAL